MTEKGKSTNALMRHIRNNHQISISGSVDKKGLLEMGYYHGYKAYKFLKTIDHPIPIESFREIKSIYDFDTTLKEIFYTPVMQIETILKNYTISIIVSNSNTDMEFIYKNYLDRYKEFLVGTSKYKNEIKRRLLLKQNIDNDIARNYNNKIAIQHYLHKNEPVPLWAIFELITLGEYGNFLLCMNTKTRLEIEQKIGIRDIVNDTDGSMLPRQIFILKELRNAIAHNGIIFNCRFKNIRVRNTVINQLTNKTHIKNISFASIVDYLILIIYYQKNLNKNEKDIRKLIEEFRISVKNFENKVNKNTFNKILGTDIYNKITLLNSYI